MEKYFITKLIWQIKISTKSIDSEFDEQLRIIKAMDAEKAFKKAYKIGIEQDETFINNKGQQVSWSFINVEFVKEIVSFDDGMEICSQTINAVDALEYIKDVNVKSSINFDVVALKLD